MEWEILSLVRTYLLRKIDFEEDGIEFYRKLKQIPLNFQKSIWFKFVKTLCTYRIGFLIEFNFSDDFDGFCVVIDEDDNDDVMLELLAFFDQRRWIKTETKMIKITNLIWIFLFEFLIDLSLLKKFFCKNDHIISLIDTLELKDFDIDIFFFVGIEGEIDNLLGRNKILLGFSSSSCGEKKIESLQKNKRSNFIENCSIFFSNQNSRRWEFCLIKKKFFFESKSPLNR